ncbi:MAG: adenine deaminase C-terminal domain-containing protein, partial [Peptostreptococcaceae bacterium]
KKALFNTDKDINRKVLNTMNADYISEKELVINIKDNKANIIQLLSHSLVTKKVSKDVKTLDNKFSYNKDEDILKLVVIERHKNTRNIGLGLVENFKLTNGAIATTIAHDSHNIIAVGDNDIDLVNAVNEVINMGGGIVISSDNNILDSLSLNIGGLMTDESIEYVDFKLKNMLDIVHDKLNVSKEIDPFMTLSFLALPVIPHIKLTDKGLFDVDKFEFIEI